MRHPGVDEHCVAQAGIEHSPTGGMHAGILPEAHVMFCARRQFGIDLAGDHLAGAATNLGKNRRVVSDAAAEVKCAIAWLEVDRFDPAGQRTGLAIV